jgi:hypothetical protein
LSGLPIALDRLRNQAQLAQLQNVIFAPVKCRGPVAQIELFGSLPDQDSGERSLTRSSEPLFASLDRLGMTQLLSLRHGEPVEPCACSEETSLCVGCHFAGAHLGDGSHEPLGPELEGVFGGAPLREPLVEFRRPFDRPHGDDLVGRAIEDHQLGGCLAAADPSARGALFDEADAQSDGNDRGHCADAGPARLYVGDGEADPRDRGTGLCHDGELVLEGRHEGLVEFVAQILHFLGIDSLVIGLVGQEEDDAVHHELVVLLEINPRLEPAGPSALYRLQ